MITVLGSGGQLGTAFHRLLPDGAFLSRPQVDLGDPDRAVASLRPFVRGPVVNCAAWTAVDAAEENEAAATIVNGASVGALAELCHDEGVPFVTFSTDYVFAGEGSRPYVEHDQVDPVNAYGRSKVVGEQAALNRPGSLVIRTSWVQSATHPCFVRTMVSRAAGGGRLCVVDDQFGRPTFAEDLAKASMEALDAGATGLLHVANEGEASWFELASAAIAAAGIDHGPEPCATADFPTPAKRPAYSVLDTSRAESLGIVMPAWRSAIRPTVARLVADGVFGPGGRTILGR